MADFDRRDSKVVSPTVRETIRLEYTCAARPPEYIDMQASNTFGRDEKGYYWEASGKKYHSELDFIQMLFTPKSLTWEAALRAVK